MCFLKKKKVKVIETSSFLIALGDKDNIVSLSGKGSRLTVTLKNNELIDQNKLKELGVKSTISMSNKMILVLNSNAEDIAEKLA